MLNEERFLASLEMTVSKGYLNYAGFEFQFFD